MRKFALFVLFAASAYAQISNPSVTYVPSAPSGSCASAPPLRAYSAGNALYICGSGGTWVPLNSGSVTFNALTGDTTSTATGGATVVQGLKGVLFCTGFSPTSAQILTLTTASSPNPCWTVSAATVDAAGNATFTSVTASGFPSGCVQYPCIAAQPATLLNQSASVGLTNLLVSAPAGRYKCSCQVIVTQAATTSSTLPSCQVAYTDITTNTTVFTSAGGGSGGNAVGSNTSYFSYIDVKAATTIQYQAPNYASSGATAMQYKLIIVLERTQ